MKIKKLYLPILLAIAMAFGIIVGGFLNYPSQGGGTLVASSNKNKLNKLVELIEREYVDDVNTDSIVDLTVNSILEKLDPHSVYISKENMEAVEQNMAGKFVGIGISFYMYKDSLAIIKTIPGGPSEKAGLRAGDRILFANNYKLFNRKLPTDTLFSRLKGTDGSKVQLTIFRPEGHKTFKINLTRGQVPVKSVDVGLMADKNTGYIKINRFAETTYDEFHKALASLKKQGATRLVVDLRDNGGGFMEPAIQIADEFLSDGQLIVKTKNKRKQVDETRATEEGIFEKGRLFILINENSASASEILAGAIQDNDRGTIVGRRSFGKGLVQREMKLGDNSAVRLTVARYYTPSGRSIQRSYAGGGEAYFNDFQKRYENGELYAADSIKIADTLKYKTVKGRTVYGGGGIIPDKFVALEGKHGDEAVAEMMKLAITGHFVFEQLDKERAGFAGLTPDEVVSKVDDSEKYFNAFIKYMKGNGFELSLIKQKDIVKHYIAAEFVRQLYSDKEYYELLLKQDSMMKAAVESK
ncbi:peptidase S41 [Flavobacterium akiainvivens]|uniref:Peptidase S41 n=1 Tax=Flavobacterium akiainvivens TaxID=1202724 RepID=A0A0M8MJB1_9FLAO|nr:S41 family peptidase [Flavobacterium akiainvivens]KOS06728.1 peptidase S41 [Flavobacterium akiainvivens]SFQ74610.1 carboxyl-terminal processing protease [Flavobacterium akiainvivens]